jgi:hypothetical protein
MNNLTTSVKCLLCMLLTTTMASASSSDIATLSAGSTLSCFNGIANKTSLFGYESGEFGSYSPTGLTGGEVVVDLFDHRSFGTGSCTFPNGSVLLISGFSVNPGSAWLSSATCNGVTNSQSSSSYSYSSGIARWDWNQEFNFSNGINYSCTIVHN